MVSMGIPAGEEVKVIVVVMVDRVKYTARVVEDQDGDFDVLKTNFDFEANARLRTCCQSC